MYGPLYLVKFKVFEEFQECFEEWATLYFLKLAKALRSFLNHFKFAEACIRLVQRYIASCLLFMKYDVYQQFALCIDLIAYDQPGKKYRFTVIYYLLSLVFNARFHLLTQIGVFQGLDTVCMVYSSANWSEREVWDMFGIFIENHPDLRRILTDYGFSGFPLRKDFPVSGHKELMYSDFVKNIEYRGISLMQEMRTTLYDAKWIRDPATL